MAVLSAPVCMKRRFDITAFTDLCKHLFEHFSSFFKFCRTGLIEVIKTVETFQLFFHYFGIFGQIKLSRVHFSFLIHDSYSFFLCTDYTI